MCKDNFRCRFTSGVFVGLGVFSTMLVLAVVTFGAVNYICPGFFFWSAYAASDTAIVTTGATIPDETLYSLTVGYYNQLIAILVVLIGLAGALVFIYVGRMSSEKAEEKAEKVAIKHIDGYFKSQEFHTKMEQRGEDAINNFIGQPVESVGAQLEVIEQQLVDLENKYDWHDEKIQVIEDKVLSKPIDEEVEGGGDS